MSDQPLWEREGRDWPNRDASRFLRAGGLQWHVQVMGEGPVLLMLHGTGAATHSWRDFAPLMARHFTVVAPDLPGHGFTSPLPARAMSLPGIADALDALLQALGMVPALVLGHSAGAAILIRMCLDGWIAPRALISVNGALLPWRGLPGHVFSPAAKLFAGTTFIPKLFARRATDRKAIERLVHSTGSILDPAGVDFYQRLIRCPGHVRSTLTMMANWDLTQIEHGVGHLKQPLFLVVGENDMTVSPHEARRVQALQPAAQILPLPGLGHLAHEEAPQRVADVVLQIAGQSGL